MMIIIKEMTLNHRWYVTMSHLSQTSNIVYAPLRAIKTDMISSDGLGNVLNEYVNDEMSDA